jgi:mRNA-degrading endonuclease RelE of RelBE toxin-antitoxin system
MAEVLLTRRALQDLKRLDPPVKERILQKLRENSPATSRSWGSRRSTSRQSFLGRRFWTSKRGGSRVLVESAAVR